RLDCEKLFAPEERPSNPLAWFDMDERWFRTARDTALRLERDATAFAAAREKGWLVPRRDAYWFAPVPRPGKIVCIGLNYRDHAQESGLAVPATPIIFSKFSSCVIATGTPAGVGFARKPPVFLKPGDTMEVEIERIGGLGNPIVAASGSELPL